MITKTIEAKTAIEKVANSLYDLELMRTQRSYIPASKYGLETICGASCETGAQ
jgi:hypothetical protein